ncbi:dTMP kinase [Halostagnicola sp. A-GB9-2]|uniref:dTMP kinase n=1 Tax=Halostagnicola sp. A-GB9-2 TaxID=3048066 RepID=UPI0024C0E263|nr:dTMP kinase [Halostagnicola sp. A-GB9-2]MDJ1431246.1 dTMP kinase [Halostagnicola sp. A-GB9-2]
MLVTLEGLDGSGKSTVWEALHDVYPDATFTTEPTSGPTGSWYGEAVYRSIEDEDADSIAELFLYTADHADHLSRIIEPALESGDLVISDRYSDSRYAYQGATLEGEITRPLEYVVGIHRAFSIDPDLTIYLDLDPETAAARAGSTNKFEHAEYLESVQENYERLIDQNPNRFVRIDASQSPEAVLEQVENVLQNALGG